MQWTSAPNIGEAPLPQRARGYWKARFSAFHEELEKLLEAERAPASALVVVGFGSGIAAWFALDEPGQWAAFLCLARRSRWPASSLAAGGPAARSAGLRWPRRSAAAWSGLRALDRAAADRASDRHPGVRTREERPHRLGRAHSRLRGSGHCRVRAPASARMHPRWLKLDPETRTRTGRPHDLPIQQPSRRQRRRPNWPSSLGTDGALALAPHRELASGRVDELEAAAAGEAEDRLGDDAAGLCHSIERRLEIVDADDRQRRRQARRPDRPASRRRSCRWSSPNRSGRSR